MFRDDWVKWGFGPTLSQTFDPTETFVMDWSGAYPDEQHRSCLDIAIESARHIYETMPKPISLLLSGGVDSQAMAYAFKLAGVPFDAYYARYPNGLNDIELDTFSFYRDHDIKVEIVDVDIVDFHHNELLDWAHRYQNNSPHFLSHMKIASQFPGTILMSGCAVLPYGIGNINWSGFGLERYSRISGQPIIGFFLSYDPRLFWEFYNMQIERDVEKMTTYEYKVIAYQKGGFPVIPQVAKIHGFERFKEECDSIAVDVKTRFRYRNKDSARAYDLLFRYPLEDAIPHCSRMQFVFPKNPD